MSINTNVLARLVSITGNSSITFSAAQHPCHPRLSCFLCEWWRCSQWWSKSSLSHRNETNIIKNRKAETCNYISGVPEKKDSWIIISERPSVTWEHKENTHWYSFLWTKSIGFALVLNLWLQILCNSNSEFIIISIYYAHLDDIFSIFHVLPNWDMEFAGNIYQGTAQHWIVLLLQYKGSFCYL